ncbi:MAG: hypothetical protein ACRD1X_06970 [Vicinamibacteria bacterium]
MSDYPPQDDRTAANEYGAVFASYCGLGRLRGKNGQDAPCSFSAFQLRDGNVIVLWKVLDPDIFWVSDLNATQSLTGTTDTGAALSATLSIETNYLPSLTDQEPGVYGAYHCRSLDVSVVPDEVSRSSTFALTNLTLKTQALPITHPLAEMQLRPIDRYRDRIARLKALNGIDVTAELVVRGTDVHLRSLAADDVCDLLSLASGTKVQWIARTDYSESGTVLHRYHASRVTKSYCPWPLIDPTHPNDTANFIAAALPVYVSRKTQWGLGRGLLEAFLDARAQADYLETRGVKLAVAMEMLKTAFVSAANSPEFVRPELEFDDIADKLKKAIKGVLSRWKPAERALVYENLPALNRAPFRNHLISLCFKVDLSLTDADLQLFVRCRNSLVHRGRFYCQTANEKARLKCPPHASPVHEYGWLLHVMDRLYLRLVDYRGPMIDWSDPGNPSRRDTF